MESKLRNIMIRVTSDITGSYVTFSYPLTDSPYPDKQSLYRVPVYSMVVSGTNVKGDSVSRSFNVIRFGIKWGKNDKSPHVVSLPHGIYKVWWDPNYGTHSFAGERGGWRIRGHEAYLIHDGGDVSENQRSASNGCIELLGYYGFTKFNDYLLEVSGINGRSRDGDLLKIGDIITVVVNFAPTPPLTKVR